MNSNVQDNVVCVNNGQASVIEKCHCFWMPLTVKAQRILTKLIHVDSYLLSLYHCFKNWDHHCDIYCIWKYTLFKQNIYEIDNGSAII